MFRLYFGLNGRWQRYGKRFPMPENTVGLIYQGCQIVPGFWKKRNKKILEKYRVGKINNNLNLCSTILHVKRFNELQFRNILTFIFPINQES